MTTTGPPRWYRFDLAALLQKWVDGVPLNNGVLLKQETTTPYAFFFSSQEYPNLLLHPRLVVRYPYAVRKRPSRQLQPAGGSCV